MPLSPPRAREEFMPRPPRQAACSLCVQLSDVLAEHIEPHCAMLARALLPALAHQHSRVRTAAVEARPSASRTSRRNAPRSCVEASPRRLWLCCCGSRRRSQSLALSSPSSPPTARARWAPAPHALPCTSRLAPARPLPHSLVLPPSRAGPSLQVREQAVGSVARLLAEMPHREANTARLLPHLLCALSDEVESIRSLAHTSLARLGGSTDVAAQRVQPLAPARTRGFLANPLHCQRGRLSPVGRPRPRSDGGGRRCDLRRSAPRSCRCSWRGGCTRSRRRRRRRRAAFSARAGRDHFRSRAASGRGGTGGLRVAPPAPARAEGVVGLDRQGGCCLATDALSSHGRHVWAHPLDARDPQTELVLPPSILSQHEHAAHPGAHSRGGHARRHALARRAGSNRPPRPAARRSLEDGGGLG